MEVGKGLSEWIEIKSQLDQVPENEVIRTATRYPVPYMRTHVDSVPAVHYVDQSPGGPLTLRQLIVGVILALAILASYGGSDGWGTSSSFSPEPPAPKPGISVNR